MHRVRAFAVFTAIAAGSCVFTSEVTVCASGRLCQADQVCASDPQEDACVAIGGCGDGIPNEGEACDDGNFQSGDGCSRDCMSDETCGNGKVDVEVSPPELCDDGNPSNDDTCSTTCVTQVCGDGIYFAAKEDCDTAGDTKACDSDCTVPTCGDRYTNPAFTPAGASAPEQCDEGEDRRSCNGNNHGPGSCRIPRCGDGYVNRAFDPIPDDTVQREQCDNGGGGIPPVPCSDFTDHCDQNCQCGRPD